MPGRVYDTYVAAIQHGMASIPSTAVKLGVVRRPLPWLYGVVDHNVESLGPPDRLLDEFKRRHRELQEGGLGDAEAHNAAMADIDYEERYRSYATTGDEAQAAIERICDRVRGGEDVALVCYENTESKRCHRTILREIIEDRL